MSYKNILIAIETLNPTPDVLQFLKDLAHYHQAKMNLLHVFAILSRFSLAYSLPSLLAIEERLREMAKKELAKVAEQMGDIPQSQTIEIGRSADVILDKAKEMAADLIILGNDKRHFFEATASTVLHHAPCDILAINS